MKYIASLLIVFVAICSVRAARNEAEALFEKLHPSFEITSSTRTNNGDFIITYKEPGADQTQKEIWGYVPIGGAKVKLERKGSIPAASEILDDKAVNSNMRCEPKNVQPGQSFTVYMPSSHGAELGVWTPDNRFLFIAFAPEEGVKPPITGQEFKGLKTLKLDVTSAVGLSAISKDIIPEKIFNVSGKYQFIVSQNLQTEDESGANSACDIHFLQ